MFTGRSPYPEWVYNNKNAGEEESELINENERHFWYTWSMVHFCGLYKHIQHGLMFFIYPFIHTTLTVIFMHNTQNLTELPSNWSRCFLIQYTRTYKSFIHMLYPNQLHSLNLTKCEWMCGVCTFYIVNTCFVNFQRQLASHPVYARERVYLVSSFV